MRNDGIATRYEYDSMKELGMGSYGVVRRARDKLTQRRVAIKHIVSDGFECPVLLLTILRELTILRVSSHPNILRILDAFVPVENDVCVVLELLKETLSDRIYCVNCIPVVEAKRVGLDLVRAVAYLHANDIVHLDIKSKNMGFDEKDTLQLFDFSNSIHLRYASKIDDDPCATLWYRAPELCRHGTAEDWKAVDMWSVGCVFAEMVLGRYVFSSVFDGGREDTSQNLGQYDTIVSVLKHLEANLRVRCGDDDAMVQLIMSLLSMDPAGRLTASQTLVHPALSRPNCDEAESDILLVNGCSGAFDFEMRDTDASYLELCVRREMSAWTPSPVHSSSKRRRE